MHNHRCYIWPTGCKDLGTRKLKFVISLGLYYQQEYRHWIASYESSAWYSKNSSTPTYRSRFIWNLTMHVLSIFICSVWHQVINWFKKAVSVLYQVMQKNSPTFKTFLLPQLLPEKPKNSYKFNLKICFRLSGKSEIDLEQNWDWPVLSLGW